MRRDEDYMIVNEGEIWRCSGTNEPYDYFVLYVGAGFITGYVVSTHGPKSHDEHGITVDETTYWYHPAKINYIRKSRLDYRICEAVSDQALHTARWYLTNTIGCGEYITQLKNECRTLKNYNDMYDKILSVFKNTLGGCLGADEQRIEPTSNTDAPSKYGYTLEELAAKRGISLTDGSDKNEQQADFSYDDEIIFEDWCEFNEYIQTAPAETPDLNPANRTRSANFLHQYLYHQFGFNDCLPISKNTIALTIRNVDFTEFKILDRRLGKKSQDFLREIFPLSGDEEDNIYEE